MWRLIVKKLFWAFVLVLKKIVESVLIVVALGYIVVVFDIYINSERLSNVDSKLNAFCQNVAQNPNFTKRPVIFRVDRGTLVYNGYLYISKDGVNAYSPVFIFPHHRTVVLSEEVLKKDETSVNFIVAHELGHIQGGLKHLGPTKETELYADDFAEKVMRTQPQKEPQK